MGYEVPAPRLSDRKRKKVAERDRGDGATLLGAPKTCTPIVAVPSSFLFINPITHHGYRPEFSRGIWTRHDGAGEVSRMPRAGRRGQVARFLSVMANLRRYGRATSWVLSIRFKLKSTSTRTFPSCARFNVVIVKPPRLT
jgi:hypothetical protein